MAKGERASLAGWIASLTPFFRRAPTTSTTPTGREGNVAPTVHPTWTFGSQPQNNNQNNSGNDPTARQCAEAIRGPNPSPPQPEYAIRSLEWQRQQQQAGVER
jgi:hypothetical protein